MNRLSTVRRKLRRVVNTHAVKTVMRWAKPVRWAILAICALGVISSLLSLAVTLVTRNLIDGATSGQAEMLWRYGAQLVALILLERLLSVGGSYIRIRASARLQLEMQRMVTKELLSKEYGAVKPFHSGELVNRVFSDVAVVKNGVMNILPSLLRTGVSFIGAAVILISMDWRFVPVMLLCAVIGSVLALAFREPMKRRHKRMQAAEDALHASTQETLENIRVVKASVSEERVLRQMDEARTHLSEEQLRNGRLSIAMNNGMGSMFDLSWLLCYLWGCLKIFRGEFTYGSLAAMIQLVGRIQSPIANAVNLVGQIYGVVASTERLQDVLDLPRERDEGALEDFDRLKLDHVSFQYEDGIDEVLDDVSGEIRRGQFIALTGRSGGGKTSLFQLLLGIYRPTAGTVTFHSGEKTVNASRGTRKLFAYVPQGNTLFSGTLLDNLTRFTDSATREEVDRAAEAACIDGLVREIGYDAVLGERGVGLSEGQAQRVAIARALLSRAPILLLDESTSALDEETEARLLANISRMRDKTVIIVTHRRAALDICDEQWQVREGRVRVEKIIKGNTGPVQEGGRRA